MRFLEYIKESRRWIITIIIFLLVISIIWQIRSCEINKLSTLNNELQAKTEELNKKITDLESELNQRPVIVKTETKYKSIKVCVGPDGKETQCGMPQAIEVEITKDQCCKLKFSTEFQNKYIICRDEDVCIPGDESIILTDEGKKVFSEIRQEISSLSAHRFWKISLLGGYDAVPSFFIFGVQFFDLYGAGLVVDIGSDFRRFDSMRVGLAGVYRLRLWNTITNLGLGIGVSTPMAEFGKEYAIQAMILFYIVDF